MYFISLNTNNIEYAFSDIIDHVDIFFYMKFLSRLTNFHVSHGSEFSYL